MFSPNLCQRFNKKGVLNKISRSMKSEIEKYKDEKMKDPVFRAKYILAKEKLNI
ncbi:MAG: hypothetical protein HW421_2538 [Ignavibacteria bacterium]|nr:hypothetical protein [Ignavibacteria bacterium]